MDAGANATPGDVDDRDLPAGHIRALVTRDRAAFSARKVSLNRHGGHSHTERDPARDPAQGLRHLRALDRDRDDPHGFWARSASDLEVPEAAEEALADAGGSARGLAGAARLARGRGLQRASQERREEILNAFPDSGPDALAGIHALKGLTTMLFYGKPDPESGHNPNWVAVGYPGPRSDPPSMPKTIPVRRPTGEEMVLEADVCVVGSGCGGGVIAGELAAAGKQVVVLEAGGYFNESDFNQLELWAYENLYLNGGPLPTAEGQVAIMAGGTLGGGSTVNWMNCLRTRPACAPSGRRARARGPRWSRLRPPPDQLLLRRVARLRTPETDTASPIGTVIYGSAVIVASLRALQLVLGIRGSALPARSSEPAHSGHLKFGVNRLPMVLRSNRA